MSKYRTDLEILRSAQFLKRQVADDICNCAADELVALREQVKVQDRMIDDLQSEHRRERNRVLALRERLEKVKALPGLWRKLNDSIPPDMMTSIHEAVDELEALLRKTAHPTEE